MVNRQTLQVKLAMDDEILLWSAVGTHGAPRLKLIISLSDEGEKRLTELRDKTKTTTAESKELEELQGVVDLQQWHADFRTGKFAPRVVERFARLGEAAAD